jgi:erythromycin esterase-like protein
MEIKRLLPARPDSFENLFHRASEGDDFFLPLRGAPNELRDALRATRLERAVGVLYLPQSERQSHYFQANLTEQFDEICWIDETRAVRPLKHIPETSEADMQPTGL